MVVLEIKAGVAHDMSEPCKCLSLDCCHGGFLGVPKAIDLAPQAVFGLVLHFGDADNLPWSLGLGLESLESFVRASMQVPCLTDIEEDGDGKRLAEPEHSCEAASVASLDHV